MYRSVMSSGVRNDLKLIFESSVNSVKPNALIKNYIEINENQLLLKNFSKEVEKRFSLNDRDVYILGAGKAVLNMCEEFLNRLDLNNNSINKQKLVINRGVLSVPMGAHTDSTLFAEYNVKYSSGALNNMPDKESEKTTQEIIDLIQSAKSSAKSKPKDKKPLIVSFISGGGSALLSLPKPGITLEQKCQLIQSLVKSGATIDELNYVRSCLSRVKGGKLAKLAISEPNSVEMISFLISDIINDPIELIASGPTFISQSKTFKASEKALKVLNKLNIEVKDEIKHIIESEDKELYSFDSNSESILHNITIGNNSIALKVAQNTAQQLGYKVVFLSNTINGEARDVAMNWARIAIDYKESEDDLKAYKGICWVGGGETTVHMKNSNTGLGGRCQEMCLAFYTTLYKKESNRKFYLLCAGTDGQDGPTDVAGVIVENILKDDVPNEQLVRQSNLDLTNHNSHNFFKTHYNHWFVRTGITGTNVMDIYCLIRLFKS